MNKKTLAMFAFAILILGITFISAEDNATVTATLTPTTNTTNQTTTVPAADQTEIQTATPTPTVTAVGTTVSALPSTLATTPATTPATTTESIVKERIKCIFKNAATPQKCYTAEDNSRFYCTEGGTCIADVNGNRGEQLTWKSTCGGYAYTIIDGKDEYIAFNCLPEGNTTIEGLKGKGFRYAYWECYNGEEQTQGSVKPSCIASSETGKCDDGEELSGGSPSCKSSETWQNYAKEFCKNKCYDDGSKCGANSFSVAGECYLDIEEESSAPSVSKEEKNDNENNNVSEIITKETLICKDSCPLEGKCYPFGYRKSNNFCSDIGSFVEQLTADAKCENNFECSSNVCVSGTCVSEGVIQKFLNWFKKLFG